MPRVLPKITDRARGYRPAAAVRGLISVPLWAAGLLIGAVVAATWTLLSSVFAAVVTGYEEATGTRVPKADPAAVAQVVLAAGVVAIVIILI